MEGVPGATIFGHLCDVRDIARAHVLAVETPSAKGRYLVSQGWTHPLAGILGVLKEQFPQYQFGTAEAEEAVEVIDNSKVRSLRLPRLSFQSILGWDGLEGSVSAINSNSVPLSSLQWSLFV